MPTVFDKLNLKNQTRIVVLNAPESFEPELARLRGVAIVRNLADARMVAIDEDWSAKRYRRGEFVKSTSPNRARILAAQAKSRG